MIRYFYMFWVTFTIWLISRQSACNGISKNWSSNNPSANLNFPHLHHYICPSKYPFVASPVLAAQLIVAWLEISANWFLVWLQIPPFRMFLGLSICQFSFKSTCSSFYRYTSWKVCATIILSKQVWAHQAFNFHGQYEHWSQYMARYHVYDTITRYSVYTDNHSTANIICTNCSFFHCSYPWYQMEKLCYTVIHSMWYSLCGERSIFSSNWVAIAWYFFKWSDAINKMIRTALSK